MYHKKLFGSITVAAILITLLVLASSRFTGASLKDLMAGVSALILFGLIITVFVSRIVLIFLGVFAIYKVLSERVKLSDTHG